MQDGRTAEVASPSWHRVAIVPKLQPVMLRGRPRSRFRLRTKSVRRLRAFGAFLSLCSLIVAVLVAGQRYFYCAAMDRSAFTACCDHAEHAVEAEDSSQVAISELFECCEGRELEASGPYGLHQGPPPLFAPVVAILPALLAFPDLVWFEPAEASSAEIRAGPSPSEARASLQVFLC